MNNLEAEDSRVAEIAEFGVKLRGLVAICNKPAPTPEELVQRDALVRYLAEEGFDKEEIFALIGGKIAVDTIRKKIAGVAKSDSPIKARITSIIAEMILHHIPFNDVPKATGIMKVLGSRNVGLEYVASLIEECKQGNQDLKSVIDSFADLKQSGMSIQELAEGLAYKKDIAEMGLQDSDLQKIALIARKNGREPGKVLDSICASDNLEATKLELDQARKDLEIKKQQIEKSKTELMKTEAETIHLQPVVAMCKDLLYKHDFPTFAIRSIFVIASKYGLIVKNHYLTLPDWRMEDDYRTKNRRKNRRIFLKAYGTSDRTLGRNNESGLCLFSNGSAIAASGCITSHVEGRH